ncbi:MAG: ChaN family lipoprotein [Elusimicrobiota bacterium]
MRAGLILCSLLSLPGPAGAQTAAVQPAAAFSGVPGAAGVVGKGGASLGSIEFPSSPRDLPLRYEEAERRFTAVVEAVAAIPPGLRDFENTVRALQHAYGAYDEAVAPLAFMGSVSPDPAMRDAAAEVSGRSNALLTEFYQRKDIYEGYRAVAARGEPLEGEDRRLLEKILQDYARMGMDLPEERRVRVAQIERKIFELSRRFQANLQEGERSVEVEPSALEGLPGFFVESLPRAPSGKRRVRLDYPSYTTVMRTAKDDGLRRRMEREYNSRAAEKNVPLLESILELRRELAGILGYPSFAHYALKDSMAGTPERVLSFLRRLKTLLRGPALRQSAALLDEKRREHASAGDISAWEIPYYAARLRKRLHGFDPEEVRSYFPVETVVRGTMDVFQEMLGLEFRELRARAYHPDVRLFEAVDKATGKVLGRFYLDLYARPGKDPQAAAAYPLVSGRELPGGGYRDPVSALAANFFKPSADRPSLLLHGEVEIFFHEFGHLMHMTLGRRRHPQFSGANVALDFVEVPSQLMENLAWRPEVLERISGHYRDTSRKLPAGLLARMLASRNADSALVMLKDVALAALDMAYHTVAGPIDTTALLKRVYSEFGLSPPTPGTSFQATFEHIVDGYEAGYYGYPWSRSFAQDIFSFFERGGALHLEAGRALRRWILEAGSARDEAESLRGFLGREPDEKAFLRYLGVADPGGVPVEDLLADSDILLLGENHYNASSVRWLANNLGRLKAAGVTHVGLESLELPYEEAVNDFVSGRTQSLPDEALQMPPGREADMRRLYEAIRENGIRVVALQRPFEAWAKDIYARSLANGVALRERLPELWRIVEPVARANGVRSDELDHLSAVNILKWFMMFGAQDHYVPGLNEAIAEVAFEVRNRFMADRLAKAVGAGGKAVTLAGYGHLEHPEGFGPKEMFQVPLARFGSLAQELRGSRLRAFSLILTGGSFLDPAYAQRDREHKSAEYGLVADADPDGEPAFLRTSERTGIYHMGGPVAQLQGL